MNTHPNAQPEERSLVPALPLEGTVTAELSLQEATLVRSLLRNFLQGGTLSNRSDHALFQAKVSAIIALQRLGGPTVNLGLPSLVEGSWPEGVSFYQFTTFDMEAFSEYSAFLPATEAVTSYLFAPKRRKANADLLTELSSHGNRFAKEALVEVMKQRLDVNNSRIAWAKRRPDELVEYKARNLSYFAPVLANPPAEDKVLESFAITV